MTKNDSAAAAALALIEEELRPHKNCRTSDKQMADLDAFFKKYIAAATVKHQPMELITTIIIDCYYTAVNGTNQLQ